MVKEETPEERSIDAGRATKYGIMLAVGAVATAGLAITAKKMRKPPDPFPVTLEEAFELYAKKLETSTTKEGDETDENL